MVSKSTQSSGWDTSPSANTIQAMQEIGQIVRQYRKDHGLSQRGMAELLGINNTYISKIENGGISYRVSADLLNQIATLVGFDPDPYLLRIGIVPPDCQTLLTQLAIRYGDRLAEVLQSLLE